MCLELSADDIYHFGLALVFSLAQDNLQLLNIKDRFYDDQHISNILGKTSLTILYQSLPNYK